MNVCAIRLSVSPDDTERREHNEALNGRNSNGSSVTVVYALVIKVFLVSASQRHSSFLESLIMIVLIAVRILDH